MTKLTDTIREEITETMTQLFQHGICTCASCGGEIKTDEVFWIEHKFDDYGFAEQSVVKHIKCAEARSKYDPKCEQFAKLVVDQNGNKNLYVVPRSPKEGEFYDEDQKIVKRKGL